MILSVSGVTADTSDPLNGAGVTPVYAGQFALHMFTCMLRFIPKTQKPYSDPLNGAGVTPVYVGQFALRMLRFYPNKTKTK